MASRGRYFVLMRVIPALVLAATTVFAGASAGSAQPVTAGVTAKHGDKSVNLAHSWGTARSCVVYTGRKTECFDSNAQADAALVRRGLAVPGTFGDTDRRNRPVGVTRLATVTAAAVPDCASGWLCLWEDGNGYGRRLIFRDETVQYLDDFGFGNRVSSYRNRQSDGDGYLKCIEFSATYTLLSNAYVSYVGSVWNDKADWVHP
jgi:hypothetical protein